VPVVRRKRADSVPRARRWKTHGHSIAFESDRAEDADLVAQGYVVLRFTSRRSARRQTLCR
jgi:hypothetical protein